MCCNRAAILANILKGQEKRRRPNPSICRHFASSSNLQQTITVPSHGRSRWFELSIAHQGLRNGPYLFDRSPKPERQKQFLPGELLLLKVAPPRDAFFASRRLRREEPWVRLEPHPPQVQPVGVPAHPDRRFLAEAAVGVLLAGERQQVHLLVPEVERPAAQLPGQNRRPRAVHGVEAVVEPHRIVKEGEQERESRVGARRLGK